MGAKKSIAVAFILVMVVLGIVAFRSNCALPINSSGFITIPQINATESTSSDLQNKTFWQEVGTQFGTTTLQIVPQTVLGFIQSSQQWRNWTMQNVPDPPSWVSSGPVAFIQNQFSALQDQVVGEGNGTRGAEDIQNFAYSIGGFTLASLDFVSLNGLTAILRYGQTGSLTAAACATSPGQIGQLYQDAFNPSFSSNQRAQFLGQALAVTSILAIAGGIGGFSDRFQAGLSEIGIDSGVWDSVKPYLSQIASTVSARAAALTLEVIQELAQRFPNAPGDTAPFTVDRIQSMSQVLHNDNTPTDIIESKISSLIQAAGSAGDPDDVATDADEISYQGGNQIVVKLSSENQLFLYDGSTQRFYIQAKFLQDEVPGFVVGQPTSLKVFYPNGMSYYQYYSGGKTWVPTAPATVGSPGDIIGISVQVLTRQDFVDSLPSLSMVNSEGTLWVADEVQITGYELNGDQLTVEAQQPDTPVPGFEFQGTASSSLGFNSGRTFLQFTVTDVFQVSETLRIYFNGHDSPYFSIKTGSVDYTTLGLISFDGTRLKFVQTDPDYVTTLYLQYPTLAYSLGDMQPFDVSSSYSVSGYSQSFEIKDVTITGQLEKAIIGSSDSYSIGRVGAEIAYNVATQKFGLNDVIINEVSQGGTDLITRDGTVVIQARLLMRTIAENPSQMQGDISSNLQGMTGTIIVDFGHNPSATTGLVILSYADNQGYIHTIVLVVHKS